MKTVENLEVGETLLVGIRKNAGGKFGVDMAEIVIPPRASNEHNNLIAMFNADDERFNQSKSLPRRLYFSATSLQIQNLLGIDVDKLEFKKVKKQSNGEDMLYAEINQLNPEVDGKRLRVIVQESTTPFNEYQQKNAQKTCKKTPKGEILLVDGEMIFSSLKLSQSETPEKLHVFVQHDTVVPKSTPVTVDQEADEVTV